jgi:WD40 repeat protein
MSPEQARGETLDARSDIFSLGLLIHEMLAGRHPYEGMEKDAVHAALTSEAAIPPVGGEGRGIPAGFERILTKSLEKDREERYCSTGEMLSDLELLKSLLEMSSEQGGQRLLRTQDANRLLTQFAVLYDADRKTRLTLGGCWEVWRASDLKRGRLERELLRKSLSTGLARVGRRMLLTSLLALAVGAGLSIREDWTSVRLNAGHTAAARRAAFSPDGRLLVTAGEDRRVLVWSFPRTNLLADLREHTHWVNTVAFSPDGRWFASGGEDGRLIVWQVKRLDRPVCVKDLGAPVRVVGFSPDGRLLLGGCARFSRGAWAWTSATWTPAFRFLGYFNHGSFVLPKTQPLAGCPGRPFFDLRTGARVPGRIVPAGGNLAVLSPDERLLVTAGIHGDVELFTYPDMLLVGRDAAHSDHGRAAAFSPDGRWIATGAAEIVIHRAEGLRRVTRLTHSAVVWDLAFSPDGRRLVSTHSDGAVLVWNVEDWGKIASLNEHVDAVRSVAFSLDGQFVASAGDEASISVWDANTGRRASVLLSDALRTNMISFTPDGAGLVQGTQDGRLTAWNRRTGDRVWERKKGRWEIIYALAVSGDGRWVASQGGVRSLHDGRVLHRFPNSRRASVYGLAFTPGDRFLITCGDRGGLERWETSNWRRSRSRQDAGRQYVAMSCSPRGELFATGEDDGSVRLFQVADLHEVGLVGRHGGRVKGVAFSPDGEELVSVGDDRKGLLWDVTRRRLKAQVVAHNAPTLSVAWSPDGRRLVVGTHDAGVYLFSRRRTLWGWRLN